MNPSEPSESFTQAEASAPAEGAHIGKLAAFVEHADTGTRAALARMDPGTLRQPHQFAALCRALIAADLTPEKWQPHTWQRWAYVAQGMALAGHSTAASLGAQLASADVSEARVTRLLVSREEAFLQLVPRLSRLFAGRGVSPNWYQFSRLIFRNDDSHPEHQKSAEALRLRIAGDYFSALSRSSKV